MSKRQEAEQPDVALSPYLSFRQMLRPAIFAHNVLLREKDRAGDLAGQANQILTATHELLSKAGLGYVAALESGEPGGGDGGLGSRSALLEAFAEAAMLWAKVIASCLALAGQFLEQGEWDRVRTLATVLDDAGERGVAKDLRERLASAPVAMYTKRLSVIRSSMSMPEIENSIEALTDILSVIPQSAKRDEWLNDFLPAIAKSLLEYAHGSDMSMGIVKAVAGGSWINSPQYVTRAITAIAVVFRTAKEN
jgi:hypothetical protein